MVLLFVCLWQSRGHSRIPAFHIQFFISFFKPLTSTLYRPQHTPQRLCLEEMPLCMKQEKCNKIECFLHHWSTAWAQFLGISLFDCWEAAILKKFKVDILCTFSGLFFWIFTEISLQNLHFKKHLKASQFSLCLKQVILATVSLRCPPICFAVIGHLPATISTKHQTNLQYFTTFFGSLLFRFICTYWKIKTNPKYEQYEPVE